MPTATLPQLVVDAPELERYRYGLADLVASLGTDLGDSGDSHWRMGVQYEPIGGYATQLAAGPCGDAWSLSLPGGAPLVKGVPFSIYAGVDCKAVGYDEAYIVNRARAILDLGWQFPAEKALWSGGGITGQAPVLNTTGTTVGTGLSMWAAVGALEREMAKVYTGRVVIHATRDLAALAARHRQTRDDQPDSLQTALGSRWCFGGGYDGTAPGGAAPAAGIAWMYATGTVAVRRSAPVPTGGLPGAFNKITNQADYFAEQLALITIDGPTMAVSVDLTK